MKRFIGLSLIFIVFGAFGQSNLIGHWPLDSNALDISGNAYHGTIHGATPDTGHTGMPGTAYRFDGVNDYIVIDEDSAFDFETLDTFEITLWMKADMNFYAGSGNDLITKWKDQTSFNDDYPFAIRIMNGGANYGKIYAARFSRTCLQMPRTWSDSNLRDSLWHFIQFRRSSDDSLRLFVDGVLQETSWDSTSCSTSTIDSLYFGRRGGTKNHSFYKGLLDDIKIYGGRIYPPGPCNLNVNVTVFIDSLRADIQSATHYQWFKCTANGLSIMPFDTNRILNNPAKGSYAVVVTKNGCTDTSGCNYYTPLENNCLVGNWPLNGNANDLSGNGFNGTVYGATSTAGRTGSPNSAYYFDGINDYITISHDSLFDFSTNDTFAISLWFKLTSSTQNVNTGGANTLLSKWEDNSNFNDDYPYDVRVFNQTHPKDGRIIAGRYSRQCLQAPKVESETAYLDGKFHHVLFVRMSDDSLRLYIDNKLESTAFDFITCSTNNNLALEFGRRGGSKSPSYYRGIIDDVKIFGTCYATNPPPPPPPNPCGLDTTLTITINAILSNENNAKHYQWYKCDTGLVKLNGDTNKVLYPSSNGKYMLVLSSDTCSDTSACMPFTLIGISENANESLLIYPNPADDIVLIKGAILEGSSYTIYNDIGSITGKGIVREQSINIEQLPSGVYFLQILGDRGNYRGRFFKR